jgi:hypothetical protein
VGADQNGRNKHANKQTDRQTKKNSERFYSTKTNQNQNCSQCVLKTLIQEQQKPPSPRQAAGIDSSERRRREVR